MRWSWWDMWRCIDWNGEGGSEDGFLLVCSDRGTGFSWEESDLRLTITFRRKEEPKRDDG